MNAQIATAIRVKEAIFPWVPNKHLFPEDFLSKVYDDLASEGTLDEVIHERHNSKEEFLEFADKVLLMIYVDLEENRYAGISWLSDLADTASHLRGFAGHVFLKRYWDIETSLLYGKLALREWFYTFKVDQVWGITPRPNRLARFYSVRVGFKYVSVLPDFTSYHGQMVDGLVCRITREEFAQKWGITWENPTVKHKNKCMSKPDKPNLTL